MSDPANPAPPERPLLDVIEDFLLVHPEVTAGALGCATVNDKDLVRNMRTGRQPRPSTAAKVRTWIAAYLADAASGQAERAAAARRLESLLPEAVQP